MKPRLTVFQIKVMNKINDYIVDYNVTGEDLFHSCSDVIDGWLTTTEVQSFIDAKIMHKIKLPKSDHISIDYRYGVVGETSTIRFTKKSIKRFWADRFHKEDYA